jgi:hypothetical protein
MDTSGGREWVQRSDANSQLLLEVEAKFSPESAAEAGVDSADEAIVDLQPAFEQRRREALREASGELHRRLAAEQDPRVSEDLEILIRTAKLEIRGSELREQYLLPYFDLNRLVFYSLQSLLDERIAAARRPAALVRLRKYAGLEPGFWPLPVLARERISERLSQTHLLGPFAGQLEKDLAEAELVWNGIGPLFEQFEMSGYAEPLAALRKEVEAYHDFVRAHVLPRARTGFRLPEPLYAHALQAVGVDITPAELARLARKETALIQKEMESLAATIAPELGLSGLGYREVIRELKRHQLVGNAILPHYQHRLEQIEAILRREDLVTLPAYPARIRLATLAESAASPAPHMRPPRLIGNTGEVGEFVLPLRVPDARGDLQGFDDFTFEAASWTLTAHEARPGHELQFHAMLARGVSIARAVFAFNSVNVEGWALYAEAFMQPYLPPEGQLIVLQHRLMRAVRAFLDPELQAGIMSPEQARRILIEDVVLSPAMAAQELDRYMFRMPGQATSYFYGYTRWIDLRRKCEQAVAPGAFHPKRFHDFVLAQGLLPPQLLDRAVAAEFGN